MGNFKKPERVKELEGMLRGCLSEKSEQQKRLKRLENQRPDVVFRSDNASLKILDSKISKVNKELNDIQDQIKGTFRELRREVEKWINHEESLLKEKKNELKEQAYKIEEETTKLQKKIEELHGSTCSISFGAGSKPWHLRQHAGRIYDYQIPKVDTQIKKMVPDLKMD